MLILIEVCIELHTLIEIHMENLGLSIFFVK